MHAEKRLVAPEILLGLDEGKAPYLIVKGRLECPLHKADIAFEIWVRVVQVEGVEIELFSIVELPCLHLHGEHEQDENNRDKIFFHLIYPIVTNM